MPNQSVSLDQNSTLALLGKNSQLAWGELQALYPTSSLAADSIAVLPDLIPPEEYTARLGGTVKVLRVIQETDPDSWSTDCAKYIVDNSLPQVVFSKIYTTGKLSVLATAVKKKVVEQKQQFRYRILDSVYASAGIGDQWTELVLVTLDQKTYLTVTKAVQDINYWSFKDYNRPGFDPRSGMMPPKVARMLINLACTQTTDHPVTVYDPFCGSGTLLLEGLDLGFSVIGSDLSPQAVEDSKHNCAWFTEKRAVSGTWHVFQADAAHVSPADIPDPVDAIVFEGYLGPPRPQPEKIDNLVKGLGKLYKGVLKNLYPLLKQDGILVCGLPEYHLGDRVKTLDQLIDDAPSLGYTRYARFTYGRPQAFVKRSIYVLKKLAK